MKDTWAQWMTKVLDEIVAHEDLEKVLYKKQSNFFQEDVYHHNISSKSVRSNQIKKYLHEILTNVLFEYHPFKDLVNSARRQKPSKETWSTDKVFWLSLNANPYPVVSLDFFIITVAGRKCYLGQQKL